MRPASETAPAFRADSALVAAVRPSPNHGPRPGGRAPDLLLLHYTGMPDAAGALARLRDPASEVSAHYLVEEDGSVLQLVPEESRAWHAGRGEWAGERDINACSIGIEIAHPGHAGGLPPYPDAQVGAVVALSQDIVARRRIRRERVLAHSDIAPDRKEDPGEVFPWNRLAACGLGLWTEPRPVRPGPALRPGEAGPDVVALQGDLARLGYALAPSGRYDDATTLVVTAFQRHFRQAKVDGVADLSTRETLVALLRESDHAAG